MDFDDYEAVAYIKAHAECPEIEKYNDDDILLVIDIIFEYFEKYDDDEYSDNDYETVSEYVRKQLAKDKDNAISLDDVFSIVKAEAEYEDTLDD